MEATHERQTTREYRLAMLWVRSVHGTAAIRSVGMGRKLGSAQQASLDLVREVPGIAEEIERRAFVERTRLHSKGITS